MPGAVSLIALVFLILQVRNLVGAEKVGDLSKTIQPATGSEPVLCTIPQVLDLGTIGILGQIISCGGDCPVCCGLCVLDANSKLPVVSIRNLSRHC